MVETSIHMLSNYMLFILGKFTYNWDFMIQGESKNILVSKIFGRLRNKSIPTQRHQDCQQLLLMEQQSQDMVILGQEQVYPSWRENRYCSNYQEMQKLYPCVSIPKHHLIKPSNQLSNYLEILMLLTLKISRPLNALTLKKASIVSKYCLSFMMISMELQQLLQLDLLMRRKLLRKILGIARLLLMVQAQQESRLPSCFYHMESKT